MKAVRKSLFIGVVLGLLVLFGAAEGAELPVPGQYATIQAGIDAAVDGDTVIVADGIYTGEGNRDMDFLGKAITVRSENGPENCIIDCEKKGRGFRVANVAEGNPVIDGFTITNGRISQPTWRGFGGGIYCRYGSPTIINCVIKGCSAGGQWAGGGGISCSDGKAIIADCVITENSCEGEWAYGGGIHCGDGNALIANCVITENSCNGARPRGGGIYSEYGPATIVNCIISNNSARSGHMASWGNGGGVYGGTRGPVVTNCTITGNTVSDPDGGGGIHGNATVSNCIVYGNGRAPNVEGGPVSYSNVEGGCPGEGNINTSPGLDEDYHLRPNSACIDAGDPDFLPELGQADIDGEPRVMGGRIDMGVDEFPSVFGPTIVLSSKRFAFVAYEGRVNPEAEILSVRNIAEGILDWEVTEDCAWLEVYPQTGSSTYEPNYVAVSPDITGLAAGDYHCTVTISEPEALNSPRIVDVNLLVHGPIIEVSREEMLFEGILDGSNPPDQNFTIQNIGGGTLKWQISYDDCTWVQVNPIAGSLTDQVDEINLSVDISDLPLGIYTCDVSVVDPNAENSPKTVAVTLEVFAQVVHVPSEIPNIQDAIDYTEEGGTVIVADGTYTGEGNVNLNFKGKAITVRSENGPENCIIDCNGAERGFGFGNREGANSIVEGFTITRASRGGIVCSYYTSLTIMGCIITANVNYFGAGGIYCSDRSSPRIENCVISNNSNSRGHGGGIYCTYESNPTIVNCAIIGNTGRSSGGGIFCRDRSYPVITNCTISGNSAGSYDGGGIYCEHSSPTIRNCRFTGNSAPGDGGALYSNSRCVLSNCTFSGNTAGGKGGGIFNSSRLWLTNCTVSGNSAGETGGGIVGSTISLVNCIVWGNSDSTGSGQSAQVEVDVLDMDAIHSCIQDDDPDDANIPFNDDGCNYNIDDDPMFVRDPNDGGDGWGDDPETPDVNEATNDDFGDVHLQSTSACINAGVPTLAGGRNAVDMDGEPRVIGLRVDMGADEYAPMIVITIPEGGEIWTAGSVHGIEWDSYGVDEVDILLSDDGGGSWETVGSGVVDSGVYVWDVSASIDSDECVISVVPNPADANVVTVGSGVFSVWPYHGPASLPRRRGWRRRVGERYGPEHGCVKWKFETDGPVTAAVTVGREIKKTTKAYIACEDGKLYALNADTGAVVWSYDTNTPLFGSAAEGRDGTVYVGSEGGKLYAINKEGQLLWTHTTGGPIYSTPAVTPNGRIYVCSLDGLVYALARDGSDLWSFETNGFAALDGSVFVSPQEGSDGSVYIAGLYDPNVYALNRKDGSVKWACNFEFITDPCDPNSGRSAGWPFAAPAVGTDGTLYQTLLYDSNLYAIEGETGDITWSVELADPCSGWFEANDLATLRYSDGWSSPAVGPDGTIYVSLDDAYLRAVNDGGGIEWVSKLGEMGGFTLTVGSDGLIYAASDDKKLYVVNGEGEEVATFEGEGWLSWPVIGADGTLYVSDANDAVWAISEEACDGETPILDGAREAKSKKPVKFKGRQIRKTKAGLRAEKWERK